MKEPLTKQRIFAIIITIGCGTIVCEVNNSSRETIHLDTVPVADAGTASILLPAIDA